MLVFLCSAAVTAWSRPSGDGGNDSLGAALAVALMGLCSVVYAVTRATAVRRTFVTSRHKSAASQSVLGHVARVRRLHAVAFTALWVAIGAMLASLPLERDTLLVLEISPALMFVVGLVHVVQLQRLLGHVDESGLDVLAHGDFMYAARRGRLLGWVSAPPRVIARATAFPIARLHQS